MSNGQEALVSVVIPARNAASTIARLLRSLVPDRAVILEILVIDDGSVDATAAVAIDASERCDLPLRVVPVAFGAAGTSRNFGMEQAGGKYLFFVDADDELFPGALSLLSSKLLETPGAGLAIGSCIRRTANRPDKIKVPHGYTGGRTRNVIRYLANELWPIAMGSAMVVTSGALACRFPETISLDEDTCFWAALLSKASVVTTPEPVLLYQLDEARMAKRYTSSPRTTLLGIARELRKLARYGVPESALKQRTAWVALRIARHLIMEGRYSEASRLLRFAGSHPRFCRSWKVFQYSLRSRFGEFFQFLFKNEPASFRARERKPSPGERRVLVITVDPAAPPVSGADLRNFRNAQSAAKLGSCRLVSIRPDENGRGVPETGCQSHSVGLSGEKSGALNPLRCRMEARIARPVLPRLLKIIAEFQPDTIVVEGIPLASLLKPLRPHADLLVLDMHNIESDLAGQRPKSRSRRKRLSTLLYGDAARIRRLERKAIRRVDRIWVCSEREKERLLELHRPPVSVQVVPNVIPRAESLRSDLPRHEIGRAAGPVIFFVGHLGYWPNVRAAERLAGGIMPMVRETFPTASLLLAGRSPAPSVRDLASNPGIELHGNPADLSVFYERADIAVIPLSEGGGTRIKVLEAMASGLPVVATPLAIEGLDLVDGEDVLVAESDEGIALHIIELWRNVDARSRQVSRARKTVSLRYGSEALDLPISAGLTRTID